MNTWILLRGLTREARHWGDFPRRFSDAMGGARVVLLDLPGNGQLNNLDSPTTVEALVAHCRAELARRAVPAPYQLLALSLGGMVASAWSAQYPQEVARCVLVNTSLRPFSPFYQRLRPAALPAVVGQLVRRSSQARELAIWGITSNQPVDAATLAQWVRWRNDKPVGARNAMRQLIAAMRYRATLAPPAVPVLVLASTRDRLVDARCSAALARAWGAPLSVHPTAGHDLSLDDGDWVAGQVREWLSLPKLPSGSES